MTIKTVKTQKEAHGAECQDCGTIFNISTEPYWHWSKSVWMHRSGTGHKVTLYQIVVPA